MLDALLGDNSKTDLEEKLLQDFTHFLTFLMFKMVILNKEGGEKLAEEILLKWRERILDVYAKQQADKKNLGFLVEALFDPEANKKYMEAFNNVGAKIEAFIKSGARKDNLPGETKNE
jgi:predicted ArsR family transcriptional regulator